MKNKYKKILLIIIVLVIIIIGILSLNKKDNNELKNDFYNYVNKDILEKNEIKDNEIGWSTFTLAQDKVDEDVSVIINEMINNKENINLNNLYNNFLNVEQRNKLGINPLKPYLNLIDNSNDINTFIKNIVNIENKLGLSIFTTMMVDADMKDTSNNIVYLYPVSFDFGASCEYYSNEDYSYYEALLKQYGIKIMKLYGYDTKKARSVSDNLNKFYNYVCSNSKSNSELSDYSNLYNKITKEELKNIYSNIDVDNYLKVNGIEKEEYFNIIDKKNYETINSYLTNDNLNLLKEHVKLQILETYADYISTDYLNLVIELSNKLSGISDNDMTTRDYSENLISTYYNHDIDKIYAEEYFSISKKEYIESMVNDIINFYKDDLKDNDWLSEETKKNAIKKLDNMKINVGYPEKYPSYSNLYYVKTYNEGSNLVENIINMNKTMSDYEISRLISNENNFKISLTTVNAYYNPLDNSINFPAAVGTLFNENDSYYKNLGSIGMIIAHEVTHAFDNNGSLFDEYGNLSNWWSEEDYKKFEEKQKEVIDYYNKYEVINGIYVNGEKTVSENIADLGAMNCLVSIAESKNATNEDYKILFTSYANLWSSEYIDAYTKMLTLSDVHSPDKVRVNAVLSSTNKFYDVYNLTRKDNMFISRNNRVKVW